MNRYKNNCELQPLKWIWKKCTTGCQGFMKSPFNSLWLLQQIPNQDRVFKQNTKMTTIVSLLMPAHYNLQAISKHQRSHGKGMRICDLLSLWSIWFTSAASPVPSAAAGDRPAAGRAAVREEPAAQTHTEAPGSTAGGQTDGKAQTQRQTKGIM